MTHRITEWQCMVGAFRCFDNPQTALDKRAVYELRQVRRIRLLFAEKSLRCLAVELDLLAHDPAAGRFLDPYRGILLAERSLDLVDAIERRRERHRSAHFIFGVEDAQD